jgi:dipeptidyl aminopeptidase/acylaminoacyl peptidase
VTEPPAATSTDPFSDLAAYVALPRLSGLVLSPDGRRLVTSVATLSPDGKAYVTALWQVDPTGQRPARRLTRSAKGEAGPAFAPGGALLFTSRRPDPAADKAGQKGPDQAEDDEVAGLWELPPDGGEARQVAGRPGGVAAVRVARDAGTVVVTSPTLAGTTTAEEDEAARRARKDADVSAILHEDMPVRYWDHDLGPAQLRLLAASPPEPPEPPQPPQPPQPPEPPQPPQPPEALDPVADVRLELRDLTPAPGRALDEQAFAVTPDGRTVLTGWSVPTGGGNLRTDLVAVDTATGERRTLATDPEAALSYSDPAVSRDGRHVVCVRWREPTWDEPPDRTLWLIDLATGDGRDLTPGLDLWPSEPAFGEDAVFFAADEQGHRPVFRVDLADGTVTRLTARGAYTDLCPSPDRRHVFALHSSYEHPPVPVRLDAAAPDQDPVRLPGPAAVAAPGRLDEVHATAADGSGLRAWLVLPAEPGGPFPLALWIHGGPLGSWNAWSWRWCPQLLAARGYAVLLPDPALSTGYGQEFVRRGWGQWGGAPYTDLRALTDAALERPDLDPERTAAMGGSYGGYLANWVAGHTERFRAIVTHAGLWALDQFQGTTDHPAYWAKEWGYSDVRPERYEANTPHRHADRIRTPMLVIHGDKDYRVPIGEGLRLWNDLVRRDVPAQFLYFPDENHWVLKPGNARVWYDTVLAFLDRYVLGGAPRRPDLL